MKSSRQFLTSPSTTRALLSIKPPFAAAILRGEKRFEFRRSVFSRKVDIVLMYVSSPVKRVVAEFDVADIITESLPQLWEETRRFAGIDEAYFYSYFRGISHGHAIAIGNVRQYDAPFSPLAELGLRAPQSFAYVPGVIDHASEYRGRLVSSAILQQNSFDHVPRSDS